MTKIAIVGTQGIPARYGGFETLAEQLADANLKRATPDELTIYCSGPAYADRKERHLGARLVYLPLPANGPLSILYDALSLFHSALKGTDAILLLGVSGGMALPLVRVFSRARVVVNVDGVEGERAKWGWFARLVLRLSERLAVRFAHRVVADNAEVARYLVARYGCAPETLAYGGDHAMVDPAPWPGAPLPTRYALALARIEPENNAAMILEAAASRPDLPLVFLGNWRASLYGRALLQKYAGVAHLRLLDPIHDLAVLAGLRAGAEAYLHGHSAGGTNPSLVEAMHFGLPVLAFDCPFNRETTSGAALYFSDAGELVAKLDALTATSASGIGAAMRKIAGERYLWAPIAREYFDLLSKG